MVMKLTRQLRIATGNFRIGLKRNIRGPVPDGLDGRKLVMADDDDDKPKRKLTHEIGQELSTLSLDDLAERVELLKAEIRRLEAEILSKGASKSAAESIFR
jgi:uncharacterized small protein (DUF1192 family)